MTATVIHHRSSFAHPSTLGENRMPHDGLPPLDEVSASTYLPDHAGGVILIVDDQAANLKLLRQLLAQTPCQLIFASSGQQALERIKLVQPDLILLDLMMPDMDGLEVCRSLQQNSATADIPIIFLTASHEADHLLHAFEYGAVDYITKPFRAAELLARVKVHLSLKATQAALDHLNQHLEQQVQHRTAALQQAFTFARISQRITQKVCETLDESQICTTVVNELAAVLNLSRCHIGIYDDACSSSTITHECVDHLPSALGNIYPFNRFSNIYEPLRQGQLVQRSLDATSLHQLPDGAMFLGCPLHDQHHVIGDIWLYRTSVTDFSDDEIRLVEQIADQTAIAIRQARLYHSSQAQVQELARLNYAKDEFLKTISHELKTPLTSIKMAADTLQSMLEQPEDLPQHQPVVAKLVPVITEGCNREIKLVNTLLEFVHLDAKAEAVVEDVIGIDELMTHVMPSFRQRCQEQQQTLNLVTSPQLPLLQTNADLLTRLLIELLDNACKYTPAGETIELTASFDNNQVQFEVSNSGVTVSELELGYVFDKFYRLPQHDRWQHGGVGLGLALVKKQVEYLGGTVAAMSHPQTFTVRVALPSQV